MGDNITRYKILFASPSDLDEERKMFPKIIEELNQVWGNILNFHIEGLMWEHSSAPGISNHSTQDIINNDFGDSYDMFIGAFWQKFGSPTKDANSGTEEEYNRAYKRFSEDSSSVHIMVYFKEQPPAKLSDVNVDELKKIQAFKEKIQTHNVLYWSFHNIDDFERCLRRHIPERLFAPIYKDANASQLILAERSLPSNASSVGGRIDTIKEELEELGIVDYEEVFLNCMDKSSASTSRITNLLDEHQKKITSATRQVKNINPALNQIKEKRKIGLYLANSMSVLSSGIDNELATNGTIFKTGIQALINYFRLMPNAVVDYDVFGVYQSISELIKETEELIKTIDETINYTSEELKAKKRLIQSFNRQIRVLNGNLDILRELMTVFPFETNPSLLQ